MAEHEYLNPAVVERAAKVVEVAKQRQPDMHVESALGRILGNTLEAMGLPRATGNSAKGVANYRLDILNTDCNLSEMCEGCASTEKDVFACTVLLGQEKAPLEGICRKHWIGFSFYAALQTS